MTGRLKARNQRPPGISKAYEASFLSWKLMCRGAHPSAEGLVQTMGETEGMHVVGATYDRGLCLVGFDHGIYALGLLATWLGALKPQEEEWKSAQRWCDEAYAAWQRKAAEELAAYEADIREGAGDELVFQEV